MPGLGLDLNLPPELQDVCRRLSYGGANSPSSSRTPPLPLIYGSPEELMTPISPRTTSALYPAPGETSTPTQSQQLMLYTVDGRAASYETKWDELHPVSQMLLLQIEYGSLCILACCSTSAA
ncbi:hypothetical protein ZEAMMB73_Zm00001d034174 [Zea mays]|uniref:Uncharacterized protein n=1 Tax=Zea mays TaxID=4577 RepID=A0A1D6L617_MAIZE|nr:hypothetical protein ZEAMMB73_Zm00001d034174 [Zea mays]